MWIALGVFIVVLLAGVIYLARLDGDFRVRRSLEIDAPIASAFAAIVDLKSWPHWSPWLLHEPDTRIDYSDDYRQEGGYYSWDGGLVGAGKLTHVAINPNSSITQKIEFIRPFRSESEVGWSFEDRGDKTRVSWQMEGGMPFLFRFMTKRTEAMIARDYDLGLALLNGYLNDAAPHPTISFVGEQELEDFSYWAIPCNGNLRQLEANRQSSIDTLRAAVAGKSGLALTIYRRFDPMASRFQAEVAIPIGESTPQSNYTRREFRGGRYFRMTLGGDHRFIPLGWYALSCHCRMHKIKLQPDRPALEIYHEEPAGVGNSNQLITALYMPIK